MQHATAVVGSDALADCVCASRYYETNGITCSACVPDHYCPGDDAMYACPGHSSAPQLASAEDECLCNGGYEKNGEV